MSWVQTLGTVFSPSISSRYNGTSSQSPPFLPQAVSLPLSLGDGKWHHVCVTWSTRDGQWEVFQDGVQRGSGANLSAWHPIKPGGIFILGQEQVKPPP